MDLGLKGKTAMVLGGGGLGRAIAKALAAEGVNVGVAGIGSTSIDCTGTGLKGIGGKCIGLTWDLADLLEVAAKARALSRSAATAGLKITPMFSFFSPASAPAILLVPSSVLMAA